MRSQIYCVVMVLAAMIATVAVAGEPEAPPPPGPQDRCAVCGMYVAKHPGWVAVIVRTDGPPLYFDGPKDMFRLLHDPRKHGHDPAVLADAWVTEYYSTRLIPARRAVFVVGSDVAGPMGAELVPLFDAAAAAEFSADHGSTAVLSFDEVEPAHLGD